MVTEMRDRVIILLVLLNNDFIGDKCIKEVNKNALLSVGK